MWHKTGYKLLPVSWRRLVPGYEIQKTPVGRKNSIGTAKQPTDTHGATHPGSVLRPDVWAIFSVAP